MKIRTGVLTLILIACVNNLQSQIFIEKEPTIYYFNSLGSLNSDTVDFHIGEFLQFEQNCSKTAPKFIVDGTVLFGQYLMRGLPIRTLVTFTDTIITKTFFEYEGDSIQKVLQLFGLTNKTFIHLDTVPKWVFSEQLGSISRSCYLQNKHLIYTETFYQIQAPVKAEEKHIKPKRNKKKRRR